MIATIALTSQLPTEASIWFEIWGSWIRVWNKGWRGCGSSKFNRWRHVTSPDHLRKL